MPYSLRIATLCLLCIITLAVPSPAGAQGSTKATPDVQALLVKGEAAIDAETWDEAERLLKEALFEKVLGQLGR